MSLNNVLVEEVVETKIKDYEEQGNTVILVAIDGKWLVLLIIMTS